MTEEINCLRCRQCSLLPESDLSKRRAVIFCERLETRREINLHGCLVADPRPRYINREPTGGDKTRNSSDVEKAWLRAWYPQASREVILKLTMRSHWMTVVHIANAIGVVRGESKERRVEAAARAHAKRQQRGMIFNAAQCVYIEECFARDYWPKKHFGKESLKSESETIKAALIARVAQLDATGRVWSWESTRSHMKWKSPSYVRETSARNKRKCANRKQVTA